MRVYDLQDKVWLDRDPIDAREMLEHKSGRYAKAEPAPGAAATVAPVDLQAAANTKAKRAAALAKGRAALAAKRLKQTPEPPQAA